MSHRLIKFTCSEDAADHLESILEGMPVSHLWTVPLADGARMAEVVVPSTSSEGVVDRLRKSLTATPNFRLAVLPVKAFLPYEPAPPVMGQRLRLSREELYNDVAASAQTTWTYAIMTVLSSIVAAVGLLRDDTAVIIGAMVIAPLLGSNLGLAFATTLGDRKLAQRSIGSGVLGGGLALALAAAFAAIWGVDPDAPALVARTVVGTDDILLALAAGGACAMSVTTGTSSALIGVMVAVALLPPTVVTGLLAGAGHWPAALDAATLLAVNLICVNLAGVSTFLLFGIRPYGWWEVSKARRATLLAVVAWTLLLAALIVLLVTGS